MRIVYLSASGSLGGAETALLNLLGGVREARPDYDLHVLCAADGPLLPKLKPLRVTHTVLPFPEVLAAKGDSTSRKELPWRQGLNGARVAAATASYAKQLGRHLRELRPDVVHSNGIKMHLLSTYATPRRVPLIWHMHDYVGSRAATRKMLRACSFRPAALITNSVSVETDVRLTLRHNSTQTIYNSIDTSRFTPLGEKADLDLLSGLPQAPENTVRVGLVATFAKWKGHHVYLEALSRLNESLPVRGYIVGAPIYQTQGSQHSLQDLRDASIRLGLASRLGFTGFCENTPAALRGLDVVVHASTSPEPFGMVIAEAMASGRAVIASRAGGAQEIFREEEDALGHEPGNAFELARQLERLVLDASLRRQLGHCGRAAIERKFPVARLGRSVASLYDKLTGMPLSALQETVVAGTLGKRGSPPWS